MINLFRISIRIFNPHFIKRTELNLYSFNCTFTNSRKLLKAMLNNRTRKVYIWQMEVIFIQSIFLKPIQSAFPSGAKDE